MPDNKEKLEILQTIIESPVFKEANRLRDLLSYLVKESLAGRKPKETTIAIDVLGKDKNFDPKDDAIVRVYINNLRTKLEHYYHTNPPNTKCRLHIPKGRYEVEFELVQELKSVVKPSKNYIFTAIIAILLIVIAGLLLFRKPVNTPLYANNSILKDLLSGTKKPTLIVLGDFFFMNEDKKPDGEHYSVRDFKINSMDDFLAESKNNKSFQQKFTPSLYTYLRPSTNWGLLELIPLIKSGETDVIIKLASQFTADDFKMYNVIFIGQVKSLFVLRKFLSIYGIRCDLEKSILYVSSKETATEAVFTPSNMFGGKYEKDMGFIVKGSGPEGTNFLLLMGFAEIGVIEAVHAVIDNNSVLSISNELKKIGNTSFNNFTVVYEAEGLNQTVFNAKIKHVSNRKAYYYSNADSLIIPKTTSK